ncbi:MAG: polysaccharide biosynthesis tyrosine autokinase [Rhodobacteraceae bacterium]|nr:polysaccharide biosynthesis tyrosine autokinase [Paracoccaceae bacterium]
MNEDSVAKLAHSATGGGLTPIQYGIQPTLARAESEPIYGLGWDEKEERFNPVEIFFYMVRHRWMIMSIIAFGLIVGVVVTMTQTRMYRAKALLEIVPPSARVIQDLQVVSETADQRTYRTALEKLRGREMAQRVVHELGLTERKAFLFSDNGFSPIKLVKRATGSTSGKAFAEMGPEARERRAVRLVRAGLTTRLLFGTSIIAISYSSSDKELARQVANQFASSYIAQRLDQTGEASKLAREFIGEQVEEVKKKLQAAEKSLVGYAKAQGIIITEEQSSLISGQIKSINEALSVAIQERLLNERLVEQINAGKATNLEQVLSNEAIQKNRSRIAELRGMYQQKRRKFKPSYPVMLELAGQIQELNKLLKQDVQAVANGIRLRLQGSNKKEEDLRGKLAELEALQAKYQDKNIRYTILKREVDAHRSQYQSLIGKLNELGVSSEIKSKSASVVQNAVTPDRPYSPRLALNLLLAFAASVLTAGGSVYVYELMNNTFSNPDQVEHELKLPVLGVLPFVEDGKLKELSGDPKSAFSEAYRTLRTSIHFSGIEGAPRSLLVTSTEPGEGKSSTSMKLAEEFGALGLRVAIIDADLRKPTMHRHAGISNGLGLSNVLTNTVPVDQADKEVQIIRTTPWPNVWLITAGTPPPNPANLLAAQKMGLFVEGCTKQFDLVIIDSPPVIGLADALLLSRLAEATLVVVSAQQVARSSAKNAIKRLRNAGAQVIGAALSKFRMDRMESNYTYRYMNTGYLTYGTPGEETEAGKEPSDHDGASKILPGEKRLSMDDIFGRIRGRGV